MTDDVTELEVTRADIARGVRGDRQACPIAQAANRAFDLCDVAEFGEDRDLSWALEIYERRYRVIDGFQFAMSFDNLERVEPCILELVRLPDVADEYADEDDDEPTDDGWGA
jgi:hypothetical protein